MSLFGKIKKLMHPEYEEPETAEPFDAPSAAGREVTPGAIDTHCEKTPFVILKDVMLSSESDLLSDMLAAEGYQFEVVEYGSRNRDAEDSDEPVSVHDRFYVLPKDLEEALDLAESVKEEIAHPHSGPSDSEDSPDASEADDLNRIFDAGSADMDNSEENEDGADSLYSSEDAQNSADTPASDDGDIYLIGTDFVLIRQFENREARLQLVRRFKEEGIPFTVTDAGDEPESVPFPGERVYVTADNKKKALEIAEELDASVDAENAEELSSDRKNE